MNLEISAPFQQNENYIFNIISNAQQLGHQPKHTYRLHKHGNKFDLSITNKQELQYFDSLRTQLIQILFENQENWFEDKFSLEDLDTMFFEYLKPNFRENCIDLKCNFSNQIQTKYESFGHEESYIDVLPKFMIQHISFDGKKFFINVDCVDFEQVHNTSNNEQPSENGTTPHESDEDEEAEMSLTSEIDSEAEEELKNEDEIQESQDTQQDLCEVEVDSNNLETMDMNLSEDDYYIVYKTINQEIKNNIVHSLNNIFESKGINLGDLNMNDIIYDSDSDSDTSEESENDFEENYKTIVSS